MPEAIGLRARKNTLGRSEWPLCPPIAGTSHRGESARFRSDSPQLTRNPLIRNPGDHEGIVGRLAKQLRHATPLRHPQRSRGTSSPQRFSPVNPRPIEFHTSLQPALAERFNSEVWRESPTWIPDRSSGFQTTLSVGRPPERTGRNLRPATKAFISELEPSNTMVLETASYSTRRIFTVVDPPESAHWQSAPVAYPAMPRQLGIRLKSCLPTASPR